MPRHTTTHMDGRGLLQAVRDNRRQTEKKNKKKGQERATDGRERATRNKVTLFRVPKRCGLQPCGLLLLAQDYCIHFDVELFPSLFGQTRHCALRASCAGCSSTRARTASWSSTITDSLFLLLCDLVCVGSSGMFCYWYSSSSSETLSALREKRTNEFDPIGFCVCQSLVLISSPFVVMVAPNRNIFRQKWFCPPGLLQRFSVSRIAAIPTASSPTGKPFWATATHSWRLPALCWVHTDKRLVVC